LIRSSAITCTATMVSAERMAFDQAGSTGGTLGKTDKSASGGEDSARPNKRSGLTTASGCSVGGVYGFDWGLAGASGVLIPAALDWSIRLGQQQLPGIYKIGGSYDTSSYPEWYTAANGLPLPLTTAPPQQNQRGSFYAIGPSLHFMKNWSRSAAGPPKWRPPL
jgi:hypothetical protein